MAIETQQSVGSYIEWGTIIAGAVAACAVSTVLLQFGAAVSMTQISPRLGADANITLGLVLGTAIWLLWVQVLSSLIGGYLAGRMRMPIKDATEHESDMRDGVHGLLVWAVGTLVVVVVASIAASIAAIVAEPSDTANRVAELSQTQKNAQVIFAFCAASTTLVSAVISWWAATIGGNHRDTQADHTRYFSFRVIR